jgi:hypothetical protein
MHATVAESFIQGLEKVESWLATGRLSGTPSSRCHGTTRDGTTPDGTAPDGILTNWLRQHDVNGQVRIRLDTPGSWRATCIFIDHLLFGSAEPSTANASTPVAG